MSEAKHTPGPWEADCRTGCFAVRRNGDKLNCLSGASRDSIVFQKGRSEDLSEPNGYRYLTDEQIANAHLIAAAPELLGVAEHFCCHRNMEILDGTCVFRCGRIKNGVCQQATDCWILRAIQKARGQG